MNGLPQTVGRGEVEFSSLIRLMLKWFEMTKTAHLSYVTSKSNDFDFRNKD